jgi:hypothetical protein
VIVLSGVSAPVSFIRKEEGEIKELIIPQEFVKDFYFRSDEHLMVMLRVMGTDSAQVKDFFKDREEDQFTVKTTESLHGKQISEKLILASIYMDEGHPLSVDIDQELPMVRLILDFQK